MSFDDDEVVPFLPPELEREIFTIAALRDPPFQLQLILVAHRVSEWIEPLIYRDMDFAEGSRAKFERLEKITSLLGQKSAQFFASSVKSLFFDSQSKWMDVLPCLRSFKGLTHLALWVNQDENDTTLSQDSGDAAELWNLVLSLPNLTYLSLNEDLLPLSQRNRQACGPVTHLDLAAGPGGGLPDASVLLSIFPRISHLSFLMDINEESIDWSQLDATGSILAIDNLSILLLLYRGPVDRIIAQLQSQLELNVTDHPRLVLLEEPSWSSDWRAGLQGESNMWTRAKEDLASRGRKDSRRSNME